MDAWTKIAVNWPKPHEIHMEERRRRTEKGDVSWKRQEFLS